jgi:hypothetical protein
MKPPVASSKKNVQNRKKLKFSEEVRYVDAIQLAAALILAHFPSTNSWFFKMHSTAAALIR